MGHFLIARAAREMFRLRQVVFIPCSHSPLKKSQPVASNAARLAMLRAGLRGLTWARIWEGEIRREGISYTVDTVRAWSEKNSGNRFCWIMGSDQWATLPSWKNPKELGRRLHFLVFPRPNRPRPRPGFRMEEIPLRFDISATEVRQRLRRRLSVAGLVPPAVQTLIQKGRWYR